VSWHLFAKLKRSQVAGMNKALFYPLSVSYNCYCEMFLFCNKLQKHSLSSRNVYCGWITVAKREEDLFGRYGFALNKNINKIDLKFFKNRVWK